MTLEEARQGLICKLRYDPGFADVEIVENQALRVVWHYAAYAAWSMFPREWRGYPLLPTVIKTTPSPTVTFNAQGEFQTSPEELPLLVPPAVTVYSRTQLSRLMQKQGWGYELPTNAREALSRHVDKAVAWTGADSGSLLRMATATEATQRQLKQVTEQLGQVVEGLQRLETVLVACLQPALKLAEAEQRQRQRHLLDKWSLLMEDLEKQHGDCPEQLRYWLFGAFHQLEAVVSYARGFSVGAGREVCALDGEDLDALVDALPMPTRGKMKKLYAAWIAGVKEPAP